jgi:hypothetical protein
MPYVAMVRLPVPILLLKHPQVDKPTPPCRSQPPSTSNLNTIDPRHVRVLPLKQRRTPVPVFTRNSATLRGAGPAYRSGMPRYSSGRGIRNCKAALRRTVALP